MRKRTIHTFTSPSLTHLLIYRLFSLMRISLSELDGAKAGFALRHFLCTSPQENLWHYLMYFCLIFCHWAT